MSHKMTLNDVLSHGPYSGKTVAYVLKEDPGELLEYDPTNYLIPYYNVQPEILQKAFRALWNKTD